MNELPIPLPAEKAGKVKFPLCPHCGRRPTMQVVAGLSIETTGPDGTVALVPKYELIPCCSAKYITTNEGPNRIQKIKLAALAEQKADDDSNA